MQIKPDLGLLNSVDGKEEPILFRSQVAEGFQSVIEIEVVRFVVDHFFFRRLEKPEDREDQKCKNIAERARFFCLTVIRSVLKLKKSTAAIARKKEK